MHTVSFSTCCHTNTICISEKKTDIQEMLTELNIMKKCGCSVFVEQAELVLNIKWFSILKPKAESSRS